MHLFSPDLLHHLAHTYGLWLVFAVVLLECLGIPMPGETALVGAAIYAGTTHNIHIAAVIAVAAAAAIIGASCGYLIGRSIGFRLLVHYGRRIRLDERRLKVGEYLFRRHGGKIVFFGRFIALLRTYAALLAGANRMPLSRFMLMNAAGGIVWATVFGVGAYLFGHEAAHLGGRVSLALLVLVIAGVIAGIVFFRRHEDELIRRAELAIPGPLGE
ncbi:MAG TPA: DedA family protein [Xanthobacteraceae bacterium]|nr:DedA family protein [Xanthobacteraceae bacterium]